MRMFGFLKIRMAVDNMLLCSSDFWTGIIHSRSAHRGRVNPLSYFSFQPVLHDWCNKGRGMCYPVCGMVHLKEPLLLIGKSSLCGDSGFPFSLSEWSLTICLTPYNRRQNVLSASLNKTFPSCPRQVGRQARRPVRRNVLTAHHQRRTQHILFTVIWRQTYG